MKSLLQIDLQNSLMGLWRESHVWLKSAKHNTHLKNGMVRNGWSQRSVGHALSDVLIDDLVKLV